MMKYIFLATSIIALLFFSCTKNSSFVPNEGLPANDLIKISLVQPASAEADSNTQITVRVSINPNVDSAQNITLTTNKGIINGKSASETVSTNVDRYVDFILKTGQVAGLASIRASVSASLYRDTVIDLIMSYPDTIIMVPNAATLAPNASLPVTISLLKYKGFPSLGQNILLSATDNMNNPVGSFTYTGSYAPGTPVNAIYNSDENYTGEVKLKVFVIKQDGNAIASNESVVTIK